MKRSKSIWTTFLLCILFLCLSLPLLAQQKGIESTTTLEIIGTHLFGYQEGYGVNGGFAPISYEVVPKEELSHNANDPGRDLGITGIQAQASLSHCIKVPFLAGEGPLLSSNNVEYRFSGALTPISVVAGAGVSLTPIAFLKFSIGTSVGTGWDIDPEINGLGRNLPGIDNENPQTESFSGVVYRLGLSGAFQFDLGTVVPGEWTHVVMLVEPKIGYKAFTEADADTPWEFENDGGENFNGWRLYSSCFLGYQMPSAIDTVGMLLETKRYIDHNKDRSTMASNGWGSDFTKMLFGPIAIVKLSGESSLIIAVQFETERDYSDATIGNRYFEYREYQDTYLYFKRIAVVYRLKF